MNNKIQKVKDWCERYSKPESTFMKAVEMNVMPPAFVFPSDQAMNEFAKIMEEPE